MSSTPEEREAKIRSSAIDRRIRHDARGYENTIKILLLGKNLYTTPLCVCVCVFVYVVE